MERIQNFQNEAKFTNIILVLGQTGSGRTSFVQSLDKNIIFYTNLLSVDWVSKINITKISKDKIRQYFTYTNVDFHYPNNVEELNLIIETFQWETCDEDKKAESDSKKDGDGCDIFGEIKNFHKLIVMDDVSGLAGNSNDFANYLTVSQNFRYVCLYIFHIIYPTKSIWQMILFQTKTFNIFPSTT